MLPAQTVWPVLRIAGQRGRARHTVEVLGLAAAPPISPDLHTEFGLLDQSPRVVARRAAAASSAWLCLRFGRWHLESSTRRTFGFQGTVSPHPERDKGNIPCCSLAQMPAQTPNFHRELSAGGVISVCVNHFYPNSEERTQCFLAGSVRNTHSSEGAEPEPGCGEQDLGSHRQGGALGESPKVAPSS